MDILWQLNKLEPGYWKSERATFLIRTFLKMHDTLMDFDSRLCWWRCSFIRHCTKRSSHESSLWFPSWWDPLQCICFSTSWLGTPEEVTWFCQWTTWKLSHFQNSSTGYKAGILKSFLSAYCILLNITLGLRNHWEHFIFFCQMYTFFPFSKLSFWPVTQNHHYSPTDGSILLSTFCFLHLSVSLNENYKRKASYTERADYQNVF